MKHKNCSNPYFFIVYLVIIYALLVHITGPRYRAWLPTPYFLYPNNENEIHLVIAATKQRTKDDIDLFQLTDSSILPVFHNVFPSIHKNTLHDILVSENHKILAIKNIVNRATPYQISNKVDVMHSTTAHTPAFPAGHAAQAYILAKYLIKIYPEQKHAIERLADKCHDCRVKAGLHYPSDGRFSKLLFFYN